MIQNIEFRVLSCFFGQDSRRFAEICRAVQLPTDLGGYYIRQLVQSGFLTKNGRGIYAITHKGKQQLAVSRNEEPFVNRPRLCAMIVAQQNGKYITLDRTRQPFIGVVEWPAGAVLYGESIPLAAKRVLLERLGVTGTPTLVGLFRRIDLYADTIFDDKLFAVHTLTLPSHAAVPEVGLTGLNRCRSDEQLHKLNNPSKSLLDILAFVLSGTTGIEEHTYKLQPEAISSV